MSEAISLVAAKARIRDRFYFGPLACVEVHEDDVQELMSRIIRDSYYMMVGGNNQHTLNVTKTEKGRAYFVPEGLTLKTGYRQKGQIQYVTDYYNIEFTDVELSKDSAPVLKCHKMILFESLPLRRYVVEHTVENCNENAADFGLAYGGLDVPKLDMASIDLPKLDVMSYNTWNFEKPYDVRLMMMTDQIIDANPDVVALQEMRWTSHEYPGPFRQGSMLEDFAEVLYKKGYQHFTFRPAMQYSKSIHAKTLEGIAVFSKYPIMEVESEPLLRIAKENDDIHQRILLRVQLKTPIGVTNIFSTHFSLFKDARDEGCVEVRDLMAYYARRGPTILAGDFNAERNSSDGIKYLLGEKTVAVSTGSLKDSLDWIAERSDNPVTDITDENLGDYWTYTTLHQKPKKRIDFIFHDPRHTTVEYYRNVENKYAGKKIQASDHRPIQVRFRSNRNHP